MSFPIARFRFKFRAITEVHLPDYSGSTFRGAFGNVLKKAVCIRSDRNCENCLIRDTCIYLWIFETPTPNDSAFLKKSGAAPHPFIFEPDTHHYQKNLSAGDPFHLDVVLLGKGIDYLPYFAYGFDRIGRYGLGKGRGKSELVDIIDLLSNERKSIYKAGEKILIGSIAKKYSYQFAEDPKIDSAQTITLEFVTPMRMKRNGHYLSKLAFDDLITAALRRIFLLNHYYGDGKGDFDHKRFIELAKKVNVRSDDTHWHDWQRYSHRQRTKMSLGGIVGHIQYEGDFREFLPILRLGEIIHIGKNTSFGLGKYRILK